MKFYQFIFKWWNNRRDKFYRRNRWHLVLDISLVVLILLLLSICVRLALYHPDVINILNDNFYQLNNKDQNKYKLDIQTEIYSEQKYIKIGDELQWRIHYRNSGNIKINDLYFSLNFDSAAFNSKIIEVKDSLNHVLSLDANQINLKNIDVGAEGDLLIKASWQIEKADFPRVLRGKFTIKAQAVNLSLSKELLWPDISILSDLKIKASLYFHSPQGDQLGIGPIPPVVGIPTKYWLIIKAINNGNDLKNLVFSAKLPLGVELGEEQSLLAGQFTYNPDLRLLIWKIDSLKASGGDYIANFSLILTPNNKQINQNVPLLTKIQYRATDILTGAEISGFLPDLDSSLPDDPINKGQGKVLEQKND